MIKKYSSFFLLLCLKDNEENKRERERKTCFFKTKKKKLFYTISKEYRILNHAVVKLGFDVNESNIKFNTYLYVVMFIFFFSIFREPNIYQTYIAYTNLR